MAAASSPDEFLRSNEIIVWRDEVQHGMIAQILQRLIRADQQGFGEQSYVLRAVHDGVNRNAREIFLAQAQRMLRAVLHLKIERDVWSFQPEYFQAIGRAGLGLRDAGRRELLQNSLERGIIGAVCRGWVICQTPFCFSKWIGCDFGSAG